MRRAGPRDPALPRDALDRFSESAKRGDALRRKPCAEQFLGQQAKMSIRIRYRRE